jgi:hypothetical protein
VDKSIHLVSTVLNESLQNTIYHGDENLLLEVACMLDELKLLSVALGAMTKPKVLVGKDQWSEKKFW